MQVLISILASPVFLIAWLILMLLSLGVLVYDLRRNNRHIARLMQWVWLLTVLYSGPLGLAVYYYSGRAQIARDSIWRRGFRSDAHCYSGCGAGEIAGVLITVGLLSLSNLWVSIITFALAYMGGFALAVGPLMQEGVGLVSALWDAFYSDTATITAMEIVAIGVDIWLSGDATMGDALFWSAMVVSLSAGLFAAFPVNVLLIRLGVKSGMASPKEHV